MSDVTGDETAKRILRGALGPLRPTFTEFRDLMTTEHPEPLSDEMLHDLWRRHVGQPQEPFEDDYDNAPQLAAARQALEPLLWKHEARSVKPRKKGKLARALRRRRSSRRA